MKYLVIGATGNIGSRVTQRLIARGERKGPYADALVDIWRACAKAGWPRSRTG